MDLDLLLDGYNTANQTISNMGSKIIHHGYDSGYNIRDEKVFMIEDQLSEEEKLKIVDFHTKGLGTYILDIIDKYWDARDNGVIKCTSYGVHKGSLNYWVKKNDSRKELKLWYSKSYPTYYMFHNEFRLDRKNDKEMYPTPGTDYGYKMLYAGKSVINQWFHLLLLELETREKKYYFENDPTQIKYSKIKKLMDEVGSNIICDENQDLNDIYWNRKQDGMSDKYLDQIIESLENIKTYIKDIMYDLRNNGGK